MKDESAHRKARRESRWAIWLLALIVSLVQPSSFLPHPSSFAMAEGTFRLAILGTTDVHGRIYPTNYLQERGEQPVGLARAATVVQRLRREYPHTLLVDSGDILQGTPLAYYHARVAPREPHPMIQAMNAMGYDAAAIGNHEYDYGLEVLHKAIGEARFPFLTANAVKSGTDKPYWQPTAMVERWGLKIGLLGLTPPGIQIWAREYVQKQIAFGDIVAAAKRWVPELRRQGADLVVVLAHSGLGPPYGPAYSGYLAESGLPPEQAAAELARQVPDIDVIFAGHSHADVPQEMVNGVLITQAKMWGEAVAVADLSLERSKQGWRVASKRSFTIRTAAASPDPGILQLARDAHARTLAYVDAPIGSSTEAWSGQGAYFQDTPIVDLVNEVQRQAAGADLSAASVLNPAAAIPKGQVSLRDVSSLYVYENTLTAVRVTGKQLRAYLEHSARFFNQQPSDQPLNPRMPGYNYDILSGVDYELDITRSPGQRVTRLAWKGKPVTDDMTFTLALNNFRQGGGGGYTMLAMAPVVFRGQTEIRELLVDYVRRKGTISPQDVFVPNWRLLPEEAARRLAAPPSPGVK